MSLAEIAKITGNWWYSGKSVQLAFGLGKTYLCCDLLACLFPGVPVARVELEDIFLFVDG